MSQRLTALVLAAAALSCSATTAADDARDGVPSDGAAGDAPSESEGPLRFSPSRVDLGQLECGAEHVLTLRADNLGVTSAVVGEVVLAGVADMEVVGLFPPVAGDCHAPSAEGALPLPVAVAPGDGVCVVVRYRAGGVGPRAGLVSLWSEAAAVLATVAVQSVVACPAIVVDPPAIELDPNATGSSWDQQLTISNDGDADLVITGITAMDAVVGFGNVTLLPESATGYAMTLPPSSFAVITARFAPLDAFPMDGSPIGVLRIRSNDPDEPITDVKVTSGKAAPILELTPASLVDFDVVTEGTPGAWREVTFSNSGNVELEVTGLVIEGDPTGEFSIDEVVEDPMVIPPKGFRTVDLRFRNAGGPPGAVAEATLSFASTDSRSTAPTSLDLRAERAAKAQCKLAFEPTAVDFGAVGFGLMKTLTFEVRNTGTAPCSPYSVSVDDGPGGFVPGLPASKCKLPSGDKSETFVVTQEPPAVMDLLLPGQSLPVQVTFAPTATIWSSPIEGLTPFRGIVQVTMLDYGIPDDTNGTGYTVISEPPGVVGEVVDCNLEGDAGPISLDVSPEAIDFGLMKVGCTSAVEAVSVTNSGVLPVVVCGVSLVGCGADVTLKDAPVIPPCVGGQGGLELAPSSSIELQATYSPTEDAVHDCTIVVESADPAIPPATVQVTGAGTSAALQVDAFTQHEAGAIDVLFVVDEALALTQTQDHIAAEVSGLASVISTWSEDVHVGVISSNGYELAEGFARLRGAGPGAPRFVTGGGPGGAAFVSTLYAIDIPGGSISTGLDSARTALSSQLTAPMEPALDCTGDVDCLPYFSCVPSVLEPGVSRCAGWNWEFVRPDAGLVLVFISASSDYSGASLAYNLAFLQGVKGPGESGLVRAHAIVGDAGVGCESAVGVAQPGDDYIAVAAEFGGDVHSICSPGWATVLATEPGDHFGLDTHFPLTAIPLLSTLSVKVAGKVCESGWAYSPTTNAVVVQPDGPCMPKPGETLEAHYELQCIFE